MKQRRQTWFSFLAATLVIAAPVLLHYRWVPNSNAAATQQATLISQSLEEANGKSAGCRDCHGSVDEPTMHATGTVRLGCVDCHGGDANVRISAGTARSTPEYIAAKLRAHPAPRFSRNARSSANPVRAYTNWLREDTDYIRFVNPGDLRVAAVTCGSAGCHAAEVQKVRSSMMTHGAMLWSSALYNNGSFPLKDPHFAESYDSGGVPQRLKTFPPPTPQETRLKGILPYLDPLPRWEMSQPGSMMNKDVSWEVVQVLDTIKPGNPHYSEKSRYAKMLQRDGNTGTDLPPRPR